MSPTSYRCSTSRCKTTGMIVTGKRKSHSFLNGFLKIFTTNYLPVFFTLPPPDLLTLMLVALPL
jgi:hypothetical protein